MEWYLIITEALLLLTSFASGDTGAAFFVDVTDQKELMETY